MNRRTFLLALGAAACGSAPPAPPRRARREETPAEHEIVDTDPADTASNLGLSSLAIEDDMLVQQVGNELIEWDLTTMRVVDKSSLEHAAFVLLQDKSIVAWRPHDGAGGCELYRLTRGKLATFTQLSCVAQTLRRSASADAIYSVREDEVVRLQFQGASLVETGRIAIPVRERTAPEQLFALPDGRIVAPGDGISILSVGASAIRRPTGKRSPRHLAPATGDKLWYSHASTQFRAYDRLALATLADPSRDVVSVGFAPSRIVHMASHGSAIAVLLANSVEREWQVAVLDETGAERWRATVPAMPNASRLNVRGCVALSATRVVLHAPSNALLSWDAASGQASSS